MITEISEILPTATAIVGSLLGILIAIIGWFVRNAFREFTERVDQAVHDSATRFDAMNTEVKGLRGDISQMMSQQAVDNERYMGITKSLVDLQKSDVEIKEAILGLIERVVRLEERSTTAKTPRRTKA